MRIGSVFDQTSTTEFVAMLDQQVDGVNTGRTFLKISD